MLIITPVSTFICRISRSYLLNRKVFLLVQLQSARYKVTTNSTLNETLLNYVTKQLNVSNVSSNKQINKKLESLNNYELKDLILNFPRYIRNKNVRDHLTTVDLECCKRISELNSRDIILFMHNFAVSVPYYVKTLKFYTQAFNKIYFSVNAVSIEHLIPLCFYAGLKKKSIESQRILRYCLNKFNNKFTLNNLNLEDIIIICNSAFKTSTKIPQENIIDEIKQRIYNQLNILKDESYFITIVKCLRLNCNYDVDLLLTIRNTLFFNKTIVNYNFTALCHILTLYADALYYDKILINTLNKQCLIYLQNSTVSSNKKHFSKQVRLKDLSQYLWSLTYLGYGEIKENDLNNLIIPILKDFVELGNIENNIEDFIGILLSLCTLGHLPVDIIPNILQENVLRKGRHKNAFTSRLNLLLTCLKIEEPNIYNLIQLALNPNSSYDIKPQIEKRPHLAQIYRCLHELREKYEIGSLKYSYEIPHLNIVGITIYDKNKSVKAFLECIDESNCTKYVEIRPHGFMKLKLRLLKYLQKPVIEIDKQSIGDLTDLQLVKYLDKKIKIGLYLANK